MENQQPGCDFVEGDEFPFVVHEDLDCEEGYPFGNHHDLHSDDEYPFIIHDELDYDDGYPFGNHIDLVNDNQYPFVIHDDRDCDEGYPFGNYYELEPDDEYPFRKHHKVDTKDEYPFKIHHELDIDDGYLFAIHHDLDTNYMVEIKDVPETPDITPEAPDAIPDPPDTILDPPEAIQGEPGAIPGAPEAIPDASEAIPDPPDAMPFPTTPRTDLDVGDAGLWNELDELDLMFGNGVEGLDENSFQLMLREPNHSNRDDDFSTLPPNSNPMTPTTASTESDSSLSDPMISGNCGDWNEGTMFGSPKVKVEEPVDVKEPMDTFPGVDNFPTPPPEESTNPVPLPQSISVKPKRKRKIWEPRASPYELRSRTVRMTKLHDMRIPEVHMMTTAPPEPPLVQDSIPAVVICFLGEWKKAKEAFRIFV